MESAQDLPSYAELREQNENLQTENARLWHELRRLKRYVFGQRTEKLSIISENQEPLFTEEAALADAAPVATEVAAHERRRGGGRKPLPADLPRERVEYEPAQKTCQCCGDEMPKIGEEVTEELEYAPARFFVREHVRIKRACPRCKDGVSTGKLPPEAQVIERGRPGAGLLAHIIVSKYCDHLPLHRQEQIFERHGVTLPRQRMCDWIEDVAEKLLIPISGEIKKSAVSSGYVHADETELQVQTPEKKGKLHKGYLWGMRSLEGDVYFHYASSRAGPVAQELYGDCHGFIQTDYYAGYNELFREGRVIRVGCWDHVRRYFVEAQPVAGKDCVTVLQEIAELYKLERRYKALTVPERQAARQKHSRKVIERLKARLDTINQRVLPKSPFGVAIHYALSQWAALTLFLEHGQVALSNAPIEREIRPIAVGRHNWHFAGSQRGARWAACLFSLIATCKSHGVNVFDYFSDVLRLANTMPAAALTPAAWKKAHETSK